MTYEQKIGWLYWHQAQLKDAALRVFALEKWISIPVPNTLDELRALDDDFAVTHSIDLIQKLIAVEQRAKAHAAAKDAAKAATPGKGRKAARIRKEQAADIEAAQLEAEKDGDFSHLRYGPDERRADRQRLVRVDSVIEAILWWERQMIVARVSSPAAAFIAPLRRWLNAASYFAHNWRTILQASRKLVIEPGIWGTILGVVTLLSLQSCADAATFAKGLGSALHIRELTAERIREAALPQRNQTRHRRVKRTRN